MHKKLLFSFLIVASIFTSNNASFSCPTSSNCDCRPEASGGYEIQCPFELQIKFTIHVIPDKVIYLECSPLTKIEDYDKLPSLNMEIVNLIRFTMCPLNDTYSFKTIFQKLGLERANILKFQNFGFNPLHNLTIANFKEIEFFKQIEISGSQISYTESVFDQFENLTWLDLHSNSLNNITGLFDNCKNLKVLELGDNPIESITSNVFSSLQQLKRLNLWKTNLISLDESIFENLYTLEELDLHSNKLTTFPSNLFSHLGQLKKINLNSNSFQELPKDLFVNNSMLEIFTLFNNHKQLKTLPDNFLGNLSNLKTVELYACNLTVIPENLFARSTNIYNISLSFNQLRELPEKLFENLNVLFNLKLQHNLLENLPEKIFHSLMELRILRLDHNKITNITRKTFENLLHLTHLNLDHNEISHIDSQAFTRTINLEEIFLNNNKLVTLAPNEYTENILSSVSMFVNLKKLRVLNLAHNSLAGIEPDWRFSLLNLKHLNVSFNNITYIEFASSLHFLSKGLILDLRYNKINLIDMQWAETIALNHESPLDAFSGEKEYTKVLLAGNPMRCDCGVYHLLQYFEQKLDPKVRVLVELEPGNLTCAEPAENKGQLVTSLRSSEVSCTYISKYHHCPEKCSCFVRPFDKTLTIDCAKQGLTQVPNKLPVDPIFQSTILYLNENNIVKLDFPATSNVTGYCNVIALYAFDNNITEIQRISYLPQLKILYLNDNNLTNVNVTDLERVTDLQQLTLHGNPWHCDCNAVELLGYVQRQYKKILNVSSIRCADRNVSLGVLTTEELCDTVLKVAVTFSIAFAILMLFVIALVVIYFQYQQEIKVWLYAHNLCLWFVSEEELDKEKLYDAFVSYSHKDEDFVVNELVPNLENGETPLKLCVHYRDWIAGEWIPNQIARSVEESRRTLVVLSPNFLESIWGKMEFRSAHLNALSEGRTRVIIIKYGNVDSHNNLDSELKAYLTMNTYIEWGDKQFWDKLRYALPHPPPLSKRGQLISRRIKKSLDDKLELIKSGVSMQQVTESTGNSVDASPLFIKGITNGGVDIEHETVESTFDEIQLDNHKTVVV